MTVTREIKAWNQKTKKGKNNDSLTVTKKTESKNHKQVEIVAVVRRRRG